MLNTESFAGAQASKKVYELLAPNIYQMEILDIEQREEKAYQSEETEPRLNFTFVCIQEGDAYGRRLWKSVPIKLVGGSKQSGLYQIISAVNKGEGLSAEECKRLSNDKGALVGLLNTMIGTQVRLVVSKKPKQDGTLKNAIDSMLPKEVDLPAFDKDKVKKED